MDAKILIEEADVTTFLCDVLVLKYAQDFYGADEKVADLLSPKVLETLWLPAGSHIILHSEGKVAAQNVLFVGVVPLYQLDYGDIRQFAAESLRVLAEDMPDVSHIAMTLHGAGFGLDEKECFLAQVAGLFDAFGNETAPPALERVSIVEINPDRAKRLRGILREALPPGRPASRSIGSGARPQPPQKIASAGEQSESKPHVFVAMPFSKSMEDVYRFGIQESVNAVGFLCERVDMEAFVGDILARIKSRIETSSLIIADLTGANANVYLEVGYAWGKNRPTLFLAQKDDDLKFDVRGQKCIIYESIGELRDKLEQELGRLAPSLKDA